MAQDTLIEQLRQGRFKPNCALGELVVVVGNELVR